MYCILHREKTDQRGIATTRRDAFTNDIFYILFIVAKYYLEILFEEGFSRDRRTGRRDDRHIAIERKIYKNPPFNQEKDLEDISTDTVVLTVADRRMLHDILIHWIVRILDDEGIGIQSVK